MHNGRHINVPLCEDGELQVTLVCHSYYFAKSYKPNVLIHALIHVCKLILLAKILRPRPLASGSRVVESNLMKYTLVRQ